jgi:import inner membrane translocase subunit TIM10
MIYYSHLYSLVAACHTKCIIQKYPDQELTKGESVCLDRCAMKYFSVTKKIEKILSDQRQG